MNASHPDFDVVVAGAGAGGAASAYYLMQAGLRVLVVERARLPRNKPCGGAIPAAALTGFPFRFDSVVHARPSGVRFTSPPLPPVIVPLPDRPIAMVRRSEFDALLLAQSGAEVWDGRAVTGVEEGPDGVRVELGDRAATGRYLVGADGATSTVARRLGLRRRRRPSTALEGEVPLAAVGDAQLARGEQAVFCLGAVPWGYAWAFPRGDCLSVGIARLRPAGRSLAGRANLRAALERQMARLGIALDATAMHGHPIPCYQAPPWPFWRGHPQEPLATRRCILVGDAAGLVDPFFGEGIRYALKSARLAAEFVAADRLAGYEAAVWREIGHSLATAGLAAQWMYRAPWLTYLFGVGNPGAVRHLADILSERCSYQGLARRMIALTALWLAGRIDERGNRR